jgi:hypothetical protein
VLAQVETVGEAAKIGLQFTVRRIFGYILVHREIGEFGHFLRRDQVRRLVHGRARAIDVPQAADIAVHLETLKGMSCSASVLAMARPIGPAPISANLSRLRAPSSGARLFACVMSPPGTAGGPLLTLMLNDR